MKKFYYANQRFNLIMLFIWSCVFMQVNQLESMETFSSNLHFTENKAKGGVFIPRMTDAQFDDSEYSYTSALWGSGPVTSRTIRVMMQYTDRQISLLAYEGSSSSGASLAPQVWVTGNTETHFAGIICQQAGGLTAMFHPLTEGSWYAFAFTYDAANQAQRMNVNGELVLSTVQTGIGSMTSDMIFAFGAQGASFNYGWHGNILQFPADNTSCSAAWITSAKDSLERNRQCFYFENVSTSNL
jgi:hypothetical protein